jgi:hypothetical protein
MNWLMAPENMAMVSHFWRFARSLHAAGFRRGDLVHNTFSYHFTSAGQMLDGGAIAGSIRALCRLRGGVEILAPSGLPTSAPM